MAAVGNLHLPVDKWEPKGVPIVMMMNMEQRKGRLKPVIRKALVDTSGRPFLTFSRKRAEWAIHTSYRYPGPIQYFGPAEVCDAPAFSLRLEREKA
jgi:pyrophosphate--fructose-6-phosphate 1-phosphotransferase